MFVRMRTFTTLDEVAAASGSEIGTSEWLDVDQARINAFADATLDHQWIHVDVERAKEGPFGGTIAHGYLTLSLIPWLGGQVLDALAGHPGYVVGALHHRDGVVEGLEVAHQ